MRDSVDATGLYVPFCDGDAEVGTLIANVGVPVGGEPERVPTPARFRVLPPVQAAVAVRRGAGVFPYVYQDPARWVDDHGYLAAHGREVWLSTTAEAGGIVGHVVEAQLPFTRRP